MKRRLFLGSALTTTLATLSSAQIDVKKNEKLVLSEPVFTAPRLDGFDAVWRVSRLAKGKLEWKTEEGEHGVILSDANGFTPQSNSLIHIRVENLKPGKTYFFRAITESGEGNPEKIESEWKKFQTLNPEAPSTRFVVWNDTHQNHETIAKLQELSPEADFLIWNGDTCNDWHQEKFLADTLINPGGLDLSKNHPFFLSYGNHDVRGKWAFQVPEFIASPKGKPYYAFRSGPVAIIVLHTGEDKPDDHPSFGGRVAFDPFRHEEAEWLKEVIQCDEIKNAPYRLTVCHIPLRWLEEPETIDYANGGYDHYSKRSRDLWHDSLVQWKTQCVISGHVHRHEWIEANEAFPYAQYTGGGPQINKATFLEVNATAEGLHLVTRNLQNEMVHEKRFAPLS